MNTTKKVDRDKWNARAKQLIKMDDMARVINRREVLRVLMTEFDISESSASTALARGARLLRGAMR